MENITNIAFGSTNKKIINIYREKEGPRLTTFILISYFNYAIGESNQTRTVPEYGHSRYLRNHKSYKKNV